jgi:hypothetical protein
MTRPLPKRTTSRLKRNALFPDAAEILRRAEAVQTVRPCEICGSCEARMIQMQSYDGFVCRDSIGCGRRQNEMRRVR